MLNYENQLNSVSINSKQTGFDLTTTIRTIYNQNPHEHNLKLSNNSEKLYNKQFFSLNGALNSSRPLLGGKLDRRLPQTEKQFLSQLFSVPAPKRI